MTFEDKKIVCQDCGAEFTHTADEQKWFYEKKFIHEPKMCLVCRRARKAGDRKMHPATCASCGIETFVPFKPLEGKEVYCAECYKNKMNSNEV